MKGKEAQKEFDAMYEKLRAQITQSADAGAPRVMQRESAPYGPMASGPEPVPAAGGLRLPANWREVNACGVDFADPALRQARLEKLGGRV